MKLRLVLSALVAGVLALHGGLARADVVFGNLGAAGTGALTNTNTDVGPTLDYRLAQGFTAASPNLVVGTVSLGLFGASEGTVPVNVGIFADNFGQPAASPLFTSATVNVGGKNTYSFSFSGATLVNGSSYWVYPLLDSSWYTATPVPSEQNSSGYAFTQTLENDGTGWVSAPSNRYSVSIQAQPVPEPSTYALAAIGLGIAGALRARRRKDRV